MKYRLSASWSEQGSTNRLVLKIQFSVPLRFWSWPRAILEFHNFLVLAELNNLVPEPFGYGASIPGYEFILFGITNNGLRSRSF